MNTKIQKKSAEKKYAQEKDYLLHLVLFVLGIVAGLLYYRIFLIEFY